MPCGLAVKSSWLQIQKSGFDSWHYQIFLEVLGLERGPLSFMSTIEVLLAPVYKTENKAVGIRCADHMAPFNRKSWHLLLRQAAVARLV
jgi:hypothetical protein